MLKKILKIKILSIFLGATLAFGGNFEEMNMTIAANGFSVGDKTINDDLKSSFSLSISSNKLEDLNSSTPSIIGNPFDIHKKNSGLPLLGRGCKQFNGGARIFDCQASILRFSGLAEMPFQEGFSFYGKLGLQYLQRDNSGAIDLLRLNLNDLGAVFGFGLKYEIKKDWYLSAESEGFGESQLNFIGIGSPGQLIEPRHSIGLSVRF